MKELLLNQLHAVMTVLLSAVLLFSCSQVETFESPDLSEAQAKIPLAFKSTDPNARMHVEMFTCNDVMTPLIAGQDIPIGEVHAYNDNENLYVNVSIEGDYLEDWFIQKIHMFIGQVELDFQPVGNGKSKANKKGIINPAPGKFPYSSNIESDLSLGVQEYLFTLPIGAGMQEFGEFDIAVHADVVRATDIEYVDDVAYGEVVQSEGAWAEGERFNPEGLGNWSMFFSYSVSECDEGECNPDWSRTVKITSNDVYDDPDGELEVTYQVNGGNGERVGEVVINRGGSKNAANGFTFTTTFIPDDDFDFLEMEVCISATIDGTATCESDFTDNGDGTYEIIIQSAPYTSTGSNAQAAESFVKITVKSDACD